MVSALFADILDAGFGILTYRKGRITDLPSAAFTNVACTDDRGREHEYGLADTMVTLDITDGPRKGEQVSLRRSPPRQAPAGAHLTSRTDLAAAEVCWRMSARWREDYFRYARTHFALDALDSYAAAPDDPRRMVPNPAKKAAAARVRQAGTTAGAAEAARDAALLRLPPPPQDRP